MRLVQLDYGLPFLPEVFGQPPIAKAARFLWQIVCPISTQETRWSAYPFD
jgi:hypothetical protein